MTTEGTLTTEPPKKKRGLGSRVTEELWLKILTLFRERPGRIGEVAKLADVAWETAQRAWDMGWANRPYARMPIKTIIDNEHYQLRQDREIRERQLALEEDDARYARRKAALDAQGEEGKVARIARQNAINLGVVANKMLVAGDRLVSEFEKRTRNGAFIEDLSAGDIRRWLTCMSALIHRSEQVLRLALEVERIHTGQPLATIGVQIENLSPQDMVVEFEAIQKTLTRLHAIDAKPTALPLDAGDDV